MESASAPSNKRKPASVTTFVYALPDPTRDLIEEAICNICFMPMVDPRVLPCCDEAFCFDCLKNLPDGLCPVDRMPINAVDELPKFENKVVLRRLGILLVFCPNKNDGECDWKGPRENLNEHITRTCQNTPCAHVADGCTWRGRAHEVEAHVNDACSFSERPVAEGAPAKLEQPDFAGDDAADHAKRLARANWILRQLLIGATKTS